MTKATESKLGELHGLVAETLIHTITRTSFASRLIDKYEGELPLEVIEFLEDCVNLSPAVLTTATKFLKDNEITCEGDEEDSLSTLKQQLNRGSVSGIPIQ